MYKDIQFCVGLRQNRCMADLGFLLDLLEPVNLAEISMDEGYREGQLGNTVQVFEEEFPDLDAAEVVLLGCGEQRGAGKPAPNNAAPNAIRTAFFKLYYWHKDVSIADIGNIKTGATWADSAAALQAVAHEILSMGKLLIVLGGSHDLTLPQYRAYVQAGKLIEVACVDSRIDLDIDSVQRQDNFLMEMLTSEPNFIRHFSHLAFQSFMVHPRMLETLDKLRFDCYRVGRVKEALEEMEPVFRQSNMVSFDMAAVAHAYAPANHYTPNGLTGEEACTLMRQAGMSPLVSSIGLYGYDPTLDVHGLTAMQMAHMMWYIIDGRFKGKQEAPFQDETAFNRFHLVFAEAEATFLQSKKTGRWWMQLPDKRFIACTYQDYLEASSNELPERWLRAMERA